MNQRQRFAKRLKAKLLLESQSEVEEEVIIDLTELVGTSGQKEVPRVFKPERTPKSPVSVRQLSSSQIDYFRTSLRDFQNEEWYREIFANLDKDKYWLP